jgi:glutamine cyclotransferase
MFGRRYHPKINLRLMVKWQKFLISNIAKQNTTGNDDVLNGIAFKGKTCSLREKTGARFMKLVKVKKQN